MKKIIAILLLSFSGSAFAESYVDGSKPFLQIEDANREAEAWAACAASYDIISEILANLSEPAQSKQMSEFANGAELAVGISMVMNDFSDDITAERFNALWSYSKIAMEEWPASQRTGMLADAERLGKDGYQEFVKNISATVNICISNLEDQQRYIDTWRELAKSGLLQFPEG